VKKTLLCLEKQNGAGKILNLTHACQVPCQEETLSGMSLKRHHNSQHNNTQHNDTQHNDTQHNDTQHNDTQHNEMKLQP
jgi:hypothetical protein